MSRTKINYKKIYEDFHRIKIPAGIHVHHADGNSHNNDISNLVMVTPEEHVKLHEALGHKIIGNFIKKADNQLGIPCSESKKRNISKALKNKILPLEHKIKIAKTMGLALPFLIFDKNSGRFIGKFFTKASCMSSLGIEPNKIRTCLAKRRHSVGRFFIIYEKDYSANLDIAKLYKNTILQSNKKMGESQRRRHAEKNN